MRESFSRKKLKPSECGPVMPFGEKITTIGWTGVLSADTPTHKVNTRCLEFSLSVISFPYILEVLKTKTLVLGVIHIPRGQRGGFTKWPWLTMWGRGRVPEMTTWSHGPHEQRYFALHILCLIRKILKIFVKKSWKPEIKETKEIKIFRRGGVLNWPRGF